MISCLIFLLFLRHSEALYFVLLSVFYRCLSKVYLTMFVLLILLLVAQLCSKDFNLRSLYGRANSENKMSIFLFPLVKYTNVLLYACTSRTFRDIFLKRFACSESSVRMWMAVRSVLLCSCLLSLRQSCTEVATRPVFYVFFCLRVTRICYSINIPACG